jgi:cytoskeletal protein CcmA (bactofilin family)
MIMATAKVRGNISAPRVGITEGANFNGSVDMSSAHAVARGSNANSLASVQSSADVALSERSVEKIITK